jgi:hypothetical protein
VTDAPSANPFSKTEFLVLEYDPHTANVSVLDSLGYSARNRDDAVQDARKAAERAGQQGLPLRYAVIRIATEEVFPR